MREPTLRHRLPATRPRKRTLKDVDLMCGFVGEVSRAAPVDDRVLYRMNNALQHRGPDDSGLVMAGDRRWGVAHRRLNIVDLTGGRQPMLDVNRGFTLVFNGEIYDDDRLRKELVRDGFHFKTHSDTEVLLALYARYHLGMFEHLRGEFAFVIIDEPRREAILVRDRMGIKPLFYMPLKDRFLFASEVKALFEDDRVPRELDPTGLTAAIAVADTPGRTPFKGVKQVLHSHYLRLNLDTLEYTEHRYWDAIEQRQRNIPSDPREQVEAVREEVSRAIRLRLRADVPVGAYLSGGVDSSIVAARMAQELPKIPVFSLVFEDSPRHIEFPFAQDVAAMYPGMEVHRIPATYAELVRKMPETVWHMERPFGNLHSVAKVIASQYARQYVRCVLTGDGGDESFCGYSTHWLQNELQTANYSLPVVKNRLEVMRKEAATIGGNRYYLASGLASRIGPETQFLVDKLGFRPCDIATGFNAERNIQILMNPDFCRQINSPTSSLADQLSAIMPAPNGHRHATLLQYIQLNSSVPEYINTIADRTENAGSVEARMPLFDHKVVELAMGLPLEAKLKGDQEKWILREAFRPDLPASVLSRRKQAFLAPPAPFSTPEGRMLLETYLSPKALKESGIWSPQRIGALRTARRFMPRNRIVNLTLTIVLTTQILINRFITHQPSWR